MNVLKKGYCRIYQNIFKAVLPYREPEIIKSMEELPTVIRKNRCENVLIVTDKGIRGLGLLKPLEKALKENGLHFAVYDETVANPTTANVEDALKIYHQHHCDAIIGFGGGSSMDCAKAVGARAVKPKQSLSQMKGILRVHKRLPLLIAVPTTAGTGSETTLAAEKFINAIKEMKKRYGIGDCVPEIREKDIPKLARYADKEANPLYPVPVLMDADELEIFYYMLMV